MRAVLISGELFQITPGSPRGSIRYTLVRLIWFICRPSMSVFSKATLQAAAVFPNRGSWMLGG